MKRIRKSMIALSIGCCLFSLMGCQSEKEKEKKSAPAQTEQIEKEGSEKKSKPSSGKTDITLTYLSEERPTFTKRVKMRADSANQFLYSFLTGQRAKQNELLEPFAKLQIKEKNATRELSSGTYFIAKKKGDYYIYEKNKLDAIKLVSKRELEKLQTFVGTKNPKESK